MPAPTKPKKQRASITRRPPVIDENQLYTPLEAAGALGVGRTAVFADLREGRIRSVVRGRKRLIPGREIVRVVADLAASAA